VGQSAIIHKGTSTARASTTTRAPDPDLQFTNVPSGRYTIEGYLNPTALAGGFGWAFASAGTDLTTLAVQECGPGTFVFFRVTPTNPTGCASVSLYIVTFKGVINSSGGTTSIDWAQQTSNPGNSTLGFGSWMRITRMT
jgi:hypothetical protein